MASGPSRPNHLSEDHLEELSSTVRDWQFTHGSLLKAAPYSGKSYAYPIGVSLFPSNFPRRLFESALDLQRIFNQLYSAVANDGVWLYHMLRNQIMNDPASMAAILWNIHTNAISSGITQPVSLGIYRSDYMLHAPTPTDDMSLKQVEFNTYSVAGGSHSNLISQMHSHLAGTGAYQQDPSPLRPSLPANNTIEGIADALSLTHEHYCPVAPDGPSAVLFVVQPNNVNIADERPIEYALNDRQIRCFRVEFGGEIMARTSLDARKALLFHPIYAPEDPVEISVVYHRAGYNVEEYDAAGRACRLHLEVSRAIKCPSILGHLATLKMVQQQLTKRENLSRFMGDEEVETILAVCMPMYPLDDSKEGKKSKEIVRDGTQVKNHVLKPCLEGGGHNIFGGQIPGHLRQLRKEGNTGEDLVLMELIQPPDVRNVLMSPIQGGYSGSVVSELGVFGASMWRSTATRRSQKTDDQEYYEEEDGLREEEGDHSKEEDKERDENILLNRQIGFSFKTKRRSVKEMSVVKGYGCFDSPFLI
ncbi:MAG: hypothetical protein OHK93_000025 [Ramalina farinacea]|uniref:Glutathione synthetase n=1 Tax=Ramalina farinacea TaxID=258253 RepID=A0AA43TN13_9LECA|nr:hypothetical protein [Ramalina farinacea]